jgi:hypothetical protein
MDVVVVIELIRWCVPSQSSGIRSEHPHSPLCATEFKSSLTRKVKNRPERRAHGRVCRTRMWVNLCLNVLRHMIGIRQECLPPIDVFANDGSKYSTSRRDACYPDHPKVWD